MTKRTSPLDYAALQRHLLGQMGIVLWVDKNSKTTKLPSYLSSLSCSDALTDDNQTKIAVQHAQNNHNSKSNDGIKSDDNTKPSSYTETTSSYTETNNKTQSRASLMADFNPADHKQTTHESAIVHNTVNQSIVDPVISSVLNQATTQPIYDQIQDNHTTDKQKPINTKQAFNGIIQTFPDYLQQVMVSAAAFELWGLRYRHWLLLCDAKSLHTATRGVWQSLEKALKKQDSQTLMIQARYPLVVDDYPEYQHYEQGCSVLLGFLLRLCPTKPNKIACLTPLPEGVSLGDDLMQCCVPVATLDEMWQHTDAKKAFWQLLHSSV